MFRSISIKLTIAFVLVSLIGIGLMGWLVRARTEPQISQLQDSHRDELLINFAQDWYEENEGWDDIGRGLGRNENANANGNSSNSETRRFARGILLTDKDYEVVFGRAGNYRVGDKLKNQQQDFAKPIEVDGEVVGFLISSPNSGSPSEVAAQQAINAAEDIFLQQFRMAIWLGSGLAILSALLVGAFLAGTLSRPLRKLTAATQELADGNLGHQVDVKSNDEIGNLAAAFNKMSADLAEGERQRQQMTADIAHDLRTPLSVILGYTEALSEGKFEGDSEIYDAMHNEAQNLNRLIDDLRTLSLADAGKLSLEKAPVQVSDVLQQAHTSWRMAASDKKIDLNLAKESDFELMVDPGRIGQILSNLISNSIRYTPAGGAITLGAKRDGDQKLLTVQDTGSGMSADQLPHIFDRFYRADTARQTAKGQSGLGLAIVKSLVEAHGATISAISAPDQGTTFTIRFS